VSPSAASPLRALQTPRAAASWRLPVPIPAGNLSAIEPRVVVPLIPGIDVWDSWPLQREDGRVVLADHRQWWFFLASSRFDDPDERHGAARIRLLSRSGHGWRDHGDVLPPAMSPGTREWAGSAVLRDDGRTVALFFTAAGRAGQKPTFEQRIFATNGVLGPDGPGSWTAPRELFGSDGRVYAVANQRTGRLGHIKAFRDPAWFLDPATGKEQIVFTASAGWSDDPHNGVIGRAVREDDGWTLSRPLVEAVGVNNELERPHVVVRDGLYYLFWSTQRATFAPGANAGPNGLYGLVAAALDGPWAPLNGTSLVAGNPAEEPAQAYSWWVTGDGEVYSFVDRWGATSAGGARFGGTVAPVFRLAFAGDRVSVV
jgi:levansucrase